ncbi:uncharacterized protein LOC125032911 [Penaeus chinensis]|uniref:uncharacterized protein LOC125032911 n=1 Tax=Penaeus chinensis TaxID=139456 RepID=UPI001FB851A5|nr:uncharacterized protein LOC125032911 [Penaeus chinensis]
MQTICMKQAHVLMYAQRLCVLCKHGIPATSQLIITANVNGELDRNARHYSQITDNHVKPPKKDKLDDFVYNLRTAKTYQKTNKWKHIAKETKHLKVNNYIKSGKVNSSDSNKKVANHQQAPYNDRQMEKQDAQNETSLDFVSSHTSAGKDFSRSISNQSSVRDYDLRKQKSIGDQQHCPESTTVLQEHKLPKQAPLELQDRLKEIYIQVPVPQNKPKNISKAEESFLLEMICLKEMRKALFEVEEYVRKEQYPSFAILKQLCAWASVEGALDDVKRIKNMTRNRYPRQYKSHLYFDAYFASALYCEGKLKESLDVLYKLFVNHPKQIKKTKDTAAFILSKVMEMGDEDQEILVLSFVTNLAKEHNQLGPALALWRAGFCSPRHRHHVMVNNLIEQHPDLIEHLHRKLTSVINEASSNGDKDLLHRTLQLVLYHNISDFYAPATSALLQHQCELGDLAGADETLRFAQTMKVQLKPDELQRFLNLLNHHKRPAPLTILRLKYGRAPAEPPSVPRAPKFEYKF